MQTLLIADSNDAFRQQLAEAFKPHYHIFTCADGREALEILRREHCDCLVLDLMLPELDGISMLEMAVGFAPLSSPSVPCLPSTPSTRRKRWASAI